jgi:hypothetical protein
VAGGTRRGGRDEGYDTGTCDNLLIHMRSAKKQIISTVTHMGSTKYVF